ncbi:uncharacterized protein BDCG_16751 [Blastomyces dermatitidis ER-3]|uniref:Uncharacterized protein n=1 Tax=Ajellomyces dermatitidis (strain ER-3 / ATCC MYA-2586) TaxID=559297 RepID=A0ABX2VU66_AJEDR|nr:uncharacterized protein BDCG_16751 [Blastomyces dermatitidis ER-3]OAT00729.1 hypothetical protein BDCG_16751 [Blastomyces dermatitidis ER-3]
MEMISLKKKLTAMKTGAVSMVKKALILEKLFQLLSQEKCDALLHMSDREEKFSEEDVEMNEKRESQKAAVKAVSDEELHLHYDDKTDLHFWQNDKLACLSMSIMQDLTVKGLADAVLIIERLAGHMCLDLKKAVAEEVDVDDIIEVSDMKKKDNSTIVSMKENAYTFQAQGVESDCAETLEMHSNQAQDLKVLRQLPNLNKHNLDTVQAARKELNKIAEFVNVISAVKNTVTNNYFFKLLSGVHFSDLVNERLLTDVAF